MAERTGYEPGTPCWVDLAIPDLEAALAFYGGLFGWEFEDAGEEAGHYHQALLRGRRVAGIGPNQPGTPPMAFWTTYLCGSDVDAHAAAVREAGGEVLFGPLDVMGQGRVLVARDPVGALFGIWQPQAHIGSEIVNEHAALSWNELIGPDADAAAKFYGAVFDLRFAELPDAPYRLMQLGEQSVAGMSGMGGDAPPHWRTYFMHEDLDAGLARVRELGGEVHGDPADSPGGRYARVSDPQGAGFALIQSG